MTLILIPMASCDTNTSVSYDANVSGNYVTWLKSHVIYNFDCLGLKSVMVTLRMLITSQYANTSASGMVWQKSYVVPNFCHLDLSNAMMPLATSDTDTGTNGIAWQKSYIASHFDHLDTRNVIVLLIMPSAHLMLVLMMSCDQKCHVALHFDILIREV